MQHISADHVKVALMAIAMGSIAVGDLFKNKGYEATYRLFNGMSSVFALMTIYVATAPLWVKQGTWQNALTTVIVMICGLVFGHKAIESFKLAAEIRSNHIDVEQNDI